MCDSYVVLPNVSSTKATMLGKNSDRPVFDCQPLVFFPAAAHEAGETIKMAYVTIDQAAETYATVGSSPYWCWGYEEGFNEYGVAIGNEAIYTKDWAAATEAAKAGATFEKGLLGMELLRLGLERGKTAREALDVMSKLVERYGQWGSGVPTSKTPDGCYNNSYIIADKDEAWVFETAGKEWIARRLEEGFAAISNETSIRTEYTCHSENLIAQAVEKGWWSADRVDSFDFAAAYIDTKSPLQVSHIRAQRIRQLLRQGVQQHGLITPEYMKRILRDHYEDTFLEGSYFNDALPDFLTVCMHSSPAGFTWGNTASSSVTILPKEEDRIPVMWWAPVTPCTSLFLPVFVEAQGLPEILSQAGTFGKTLCAPEDAVEDTYKEGSFWWEIRNLLDEIKGDEEGCCFTKCRQIVRSIFDELEARWMLEIKAVEARAVALKKDGRKDEAAKTLYAFTERCVNEALEGIRKARFLIAHD